MMTRTGEKYGPLSESWGDIRIFPRQLREILGGETRRYVTNLPISECLQRLADVLTPSQIRPGNAQAIGEVGSRSFIFRLRGGFSHDTGVAPYLYGILESRGRETCITVRRAIPVVMIFPALLFNVFALLVLLIFVGRLASDAHSFREDVAGNLIALGFIPVALFIDVAAVVLLGEMLKMKHFEFMAKLLDAEQVDVPETELVFNWTG